MNTIGIIGAMDEEIEILKDKMSVTKTTKKAKMVFYEGQLSGKQVVLVRCGIGKVNAASCTQILITSFNVDGIINTGVAGAIYDKLEIGDMVISTDVIHHDFDATGFGYELGQIPRLDTYIFKADKTLINSAQRVTKEACNDHKTWVGRVLSGDVFVSSPEMKDQLWRNFEGYCAEMEGASIGHVCYLNDVPFVILRSMSDKADGSAHVNYNDFVQKAANNSANIVEKMIASL